MRLPDMLGVLDNDVDRLTGWNRLRYTKRQAMIKVDMARNKAQNSVLRAKVIWL